MKHSELRRMLLGCRGQGEGGGGGGGGGQRRVSQPEHKRHIILNRVDVAVN